MGQTVLKEITPVILTFNEEANIGRTVERLKWARDIVVVDSFSTDGTAAIVSRVPQARLFLRHFDSHAQQWNYAISATSIRTEWFLALDADYVLSDELVVEMARLRPDPAIVGYSIGFRYCVAGSPLRATLYPPVAILCRLGKARYEQQGHTQRVVVCGSLAALAAKILHDDRKPLSRWVASQQRYARLEADYLLAADRARLGVMGRIRCWGWAAPILVFFWTLVTKGCILNGWRGWFYVMQRTFAEMLIALEIVERRLAKAIKRPHANTTDS
jgi:glycosyltransferase involved in cell wall biosynthesis